MANTCEVNFPQTEERDTTLQSQAKLLTTTDKDSRLSWIVCGVVIVTQIFILGVLHAFGIILVALTQEFVTSKAKIGLYQIPSHLKGVHLDVIYTIVLKV